MTEDSETDEAETEAEADPETETKTERGTTEDDEAVADDVVVDLDSAQEYESRIRELQETVEEQSEQISELEDLLLDLSVRVADDKGMGVCPECHGPVQKVGRWFGPTTIECRSCGEVFYER